jgi:hypothetical protein
MARFEVASVPVAAVDAATAPLTYSQSLAPSYTPATWLQALVAAGAETLLRVPFENATWNVKLPFDTSRSYESEPPLADDGAAGDGGGGLHPRGGGHARGEADARLVGQLDHVVALAKRARAITFGGVNPPFTIFLLSPANLGGRRAAMVLNPRAEFELARQLRSAEGAALGDVFSFVSGLYFRGKAAYARAFGRTPDGLASGLVISAGEGLRPLAERVTLPRLRAWAEVSIDERNRAFTEPLVEHAEALERAHGGDARIVLLGSVASDKYVRPLTRVFGDHLLFPPDFVGRGDMSRGSLMLRAARAGRELAYAPVEGALRRGRRAPGVAAMGG